MYYVYVICNPDGNLYIGYSSDLRRRISEHNSGQNKSTRQSKWKLVYYEAYLSKEDAINREQKLKQHGQAKCHLKDRIKESLQKGVLS